MKRLVGMALACSTIMGLADLNESIPLEDGAWETVASLPAQANQFTGSHLSPTLMNEYQVRTVKEAGMSGSSNRAAIVLQQEELKGSE